MDIGEVEAKIASVRAVTGLPVGVGFGIRDAESAAQLAKVADDVIVGSAIVERIAQAAGPDEAVRNAAAFVRSLRSALPTREASPV